MRRLRDRLLSALKPRPAHAPPEEIAPGQFYLVTIGGYEVVGLVLSYDAEAVTLEVRGTWGPGTITRPWEVITEWKRI